jgi:putative transcription factor
LSQKVLAQRINEKAATIQQLEQGKAQPNANLIRKLERTLGCKLPR